MNTGGETQTRTKSQAMPPRSKAQAAFGSAVILLFLSGLVVYFTIVRLLESERWIVHTYEVQAALGDIDSAVARAGRARSGYVATGENGFLNDFDLAAPELVQRLQHLRDLTKDNPEQRKLCSRLEKLTAQRVDLFRESIELRETSPQDEQKQGSLTLQGLPLASDVTVLMQQMRDQEDRLLAVRAKVAHRWFALAVFVLTLTFILALMLFSVHYRLLSAELDAHEQAERAAREGEDSLRRLTGRLLQLQDEERRRFSRELHDSLGQYLAGLKMNLDMIAKARPGEQLLSEAVSLLDQCIAETRTISHLLHPPLLDEAGFASAAKWFLEGFGQRSGIEVRLDLPKDMRRLPKPVETVLFRVLQESLTNIHRHSGSKTVEIGMKISPAKAALMVRDHGKGIPPELLTSFRRGLSTGVGLAGMRERVGELGGDLKIQSSTLGTLIVVTIPLRESAEQGNVAAAD
jgi:signal transduction histidine kinase